MGISVLNDLLSLGISTSTTLYDRRIGVCRGSTFTIKEGVNETRGLVRVFFLVNSVISALMAETSRATMITRCPRIAIINSNATILSVAVTLIIIVTLNVRSRRVRTILLSPFLLYRENPMTP